MSDPQKYTVGWICAITTEFVAAQAFLDEKHDNLKVAADNDDNNYAMGKIGEHNVVMAVLPKSEYGTTSAATVARNMVRTFPNVRFGLMVGIGGGAPSAKHDIRLGDVVVSARSSGKGGVFQYDYGKAIQEHAFEATGSLNQPPQLLLAALSGLEAKHELDGHQLSNNIESVLEQRPRLRKKYSRPHPDTDRLYRSDIVHQGSDACGDVCLNNSACLVDRKERGNEEDGPAIHYGLIASANQLMKDAIARDKLSASMDVLCFEMEAAGLMNHFPCLVIRGICDYSDSHKNNDWQGFAAMVAAAYAKDLLCQVVPSRVEAERRISDILSGSQEIAQEHRDVSKEHRDIAKEQLQAQKDLAKEKLSEEQQRCHQLFRLTASSKDVTYEWYKDRVEERVEGTCMWFLKHNHFQTWLNQASGPLLVSADPGCGKSVLAKYLIDHALPRSATICYFFFQDQDQNTIRQALCALLHQLFSLKPSLIEHAMPQFRKDGQGLINSTESLWEVLCNATRDPQAGPVTIVLDALDECAELEFADLMRNVEKQFRSDQLGYGKLKYLLTCRPYDQILSKFHVLLNAFPNIHIPGEDESETISQEVNYVIRRRINQLVMEKRLTAQIKNHLEKKLQEASHRTYLWVHLVFDYLQKRNFKKTLEGIESSIATLPTSVNEAYEKILNKTERDPMVLKVLCIILAARRPLDLSEMNVAVNIDDKYRSIHDLDLEKDEVFKTARDFLLADLASPQAVSSELPWHHSITTRYAHAVLAKLVIVRLLLEKGAGVEAKDSTFGNTPLSWAAMNGHAAVVKLLIGRGAELEVKNNNGDTPFSRATDNGHEAVAKLLIEQGAVIETKNKDGHTPLSLASNNSHEAAAKLLIEQGAVIETKSQQDCTPLWRAAKNGHEAVVKLLIERGAELEARSNNGDTPLSRAADNGHEAVVKLLMEQGARFETKNKDGHTPLSGAACFGREAMAKLLIERGAEIDTRSQEGCTPLWRAAKNGHEAVVKLLIEQGAELEARSNNGDTPLSRAADNGHEAVVKLLVEQGALIETMNKDGHTPLSGAACFGREAMAKLLIERGAEID
ncbi:unnamed protein product, partial [Fusarium graminearum]